MSTNKTSSLTMENIRCFAKAKIELRPLTILLGENNTGKTTTLASHQTALSILGVPSTATGMVPFNHMPHRMGKFKDIVRKDSKPTNSSKRKASPIILTHDYGHLKCTTRYGEDHLGEVSVDRILFQLDNDEQTALEMLLHDKDAITNIPRKAPNKLSFKVPRKLIEAHELRGYLQSVLLPRVQEIVINMNDGTPSILKSVVDSITKALPTNGLISIPAQKPVLERQYDLSDMIEDVGFAYSIPRKLYEHYKAGSSHWKKLKKRIDELGKQTGVFDDFNIRCDDSVMGGFELTGRHLGNEINIFDMGIGIWPALAQLIVMEDLAILKRKNQFHIQHLEEFSHPRLHTSLLQFIYRYIEQGSEFLVETHSDLILMRLAVDIFDKKINPDLVTIAYFEHDVQSQSCRIHNLRFGEDGLLLYQPDSYRKFYYDLTEKYVMASVGIGS